MQYRALKNFKIGRMTTQAGELYSGGDIEYLLSLQLIAPVQESEEVPPVGADAHEELPVEAEPEAPKKGKKKKG